MDESKEEGFRVSGFRNYKGSGFKVKALTSKCAIPEVLDIEVSGHACS